MPDDGRTRIRSPAPPAARPNLMQLAPPDPLDNTPTEPAADKRPWAWIAALVVLFGVALALRIEVVNRARFAGLGDPSFYFQVAENLAERGRIEVDYIWHYLEKPDTITHPANDYWPVLASVLMAVPLALGGGLHSALWVTVLFGLLAGLGAWFIARAFGASHFVAFASAAFALFHSELIDASTSVEARVFFTAFVTACFACLVRGAKTPRSYAWAALFAGLAFSTRSDGIFLVPALVIAIFFGPHSSEVRKRGLIVAAGVFLLAITPLLLTNLINTGALMPKGPSRTFFTREYADIYSYTKPLDWETYRAWGWDNIWKSKREAMASNYSQLRRQLDFGMWLLVGFGLVKCALFDKKRRSAIYALLFMVAAQFAFYGLIASTVATHGSYRRAGQALLPSLAVIAFLSLDRPSIRRLSLNQKVLWPVSFALIIWLGFPNLASSFDKARHEVAQNGKLGHQVRIMCQAVRQSVREGDPEIVLMTGAPWELNAVGGFKTVRLPSDGPKAMDLVIERYGVTHIIMPPTDPSLTPEIAATDPRFEVVDLKGKPGPVIYRVIRG